MSRKDDSIPESFQGNATHTTYIGNKKFALLLFSNRTLKIDLISRT